MHLKLGYIVLCTIDLRIEKTFPYTKLSVRNGRCENRLCARTPRARQGSCRIW